MRARRQQNNGIWGVSATCWGVLASVLVGSKSSKLIWGTVPLWVKYYQLELAAVFMSILRKIRLLLAKATLNALRSCIFTKNDVL